MKTRKPLLIISGCMLALLPLLTSCGSTRAYWGVEQDYEYCTPAYRHSPPGHHKYHKYHKKPKKYKYHKPPKHHKRYKHHHDDDD